MLNWTDPTAAFTAEKENSAFSSNDFLGGSSDHRSDHFSDAPSINLALDPLKEASANGRISSSQKVEPVRVEDKRIVNGKGDINQLAPFKYPWAWNFWLNANKNHWTPLDINMTKDIADYNHRLTVEEKHLYENVLAYLTTSDILAMRNVGLAVMEKMTAPELQIYQARQVYEEALHTWTYQHCIESIGIEQSEI